MNKKLCIFLYTIFSIFIHISTANAQEKSKEETSYFKLQLDYLNNYVYNGRADSINAPYQTITASYHAKNGIYISGAASYLLEKGQNRFDFFQFDLGYEYKLGERIGGELYASKYFYNNNANLLNGNISADIGGSFNYDVGIFQINNTVDVFFSNAADFLYNPGLEKSINIGNTDAAGQWSITPGMYANIGSINYYESVVSRKIRGVKAKNVTPAYPIITDVTTVKNPGIKLMDYEFAMPISYEINNWNFSFTPTLAIPVNPIYTSSVITTTLANGTSSAITNNSTPYTEKNLQNNFYFQIGLSYKF